MVNKIKKVLLFTVDTRSVLLFRKNFILHLINENVSLTISCNFPSQELIKFCNEHNIILLNNNITKNSKNIFSFLYELYYSYKVLRSKNYEIIISFFVKPILYSGLLFYFKKKVNMVAVLEGLGQGLSEEKQFSIVGSIAKISFNRFDKFYVLNKRDRDVCKNKYKRKNTINILNGIGLDFSEVVDRDLNKINNNNFTISMVSRLIISKGIFHFTSIAKELGRKYPEKFSFEVAGDFNDNNDQKFIKTFLNMCKKYNINYLNYLENPLEYLSNIDILIHLTDYREGYSRIIMEGLSSGCIVICSKEPGCIAVIEDFPGAFSFKSDEYSKIINKIIEIKSMTKRESSELRIKNIRLAKKKI